MAEKKFVPLYRKVYLDLRERIEKGEFVPGERLPYERELCQHYNVKRVTVRRALELLSEEGLIEKRMGLGSFVKHPLSIADMDDAAGSASPPMENSGGNKTILFIMRRNENDIHHNTTSCNTLLFFAMEQICRQHGYLLSYVSFEDEQTVLQIIQRNTFSGVFLVSSFQDQTLRDVLYRQHIPTVLLNSVDPNFTSVMPDNQGALGLVVSHLYEMGHRRIGFIGGMPESLNAQERWESFCFAMHQHGLSVDPALYRVGNWTYEGGRNAVKELLTVQPRPTAVFAASDMMAAGAMDELKHRGVHVPEDISVVGFDNLDVDVLLSPPLTSATVDFTQMARVAFGHLLFSIRGSGAEKDNYTIRMTPTIIKRASVRCCFPMEEHAY